jgi:DNA-binding response OmpR family regulator
MRPPSRDNPHGWSAAEGAGIPEAEDGPRVFVVEDDPAIREVLISTLRLSGYRVRTAAEGDQVMPVTTDFRPQLVLMDLMLPGVDGWELTRRIKARPELGMPPVIVLSARVREDDRARAIEAGASEFVPKPCRATTLVEVVKRYLPV